MPILSGSTLSRQVVRGFPRVSRLKMPHLTVTRAALAAGAILATAVFLILFESTHYVATGWTDETDVNW